MRTARRLAEIKVIFDTYNRERNRHTDANITGLVEYVGDPKTMEGSMIELVDPIQRHIHATTVCDTIVPNDASDLKLP